MSWMTILKRKKTCKIPVQGTWPAQRQMVTRRKPKCRVKLSRCGRRGPVVDALHHQSRPTDRTWPPPPILLSGSNRWRETYGLKRREIKWIVDNSGTLRRPSLIESIFSISSFCWLRPFAQGCPARKGKPVKKKLNFYCSEKKMKKKSAEIARRLPIWWRQ